MCFTIICNLKQLFNAFLSQNCNNLGTGTVVNVLHHVTIIPLIISDYKFGCKFKIYTQTYTPKWR